MKDMAIQCAAKGLEHKIPQVGFEIAKVTKKHNRLKNALGVAANYTKSTLKALFCT